MLNILSLIVPLISCTGKDVPQDSAQKSEFKPKKELQYLEFAPFKVVAFRFEESIIIPQFFPSLEEFAQDSNWFSLKEPKDEIKRFLIHKFYNEDVFDGEDIDRTELVNRLNTNQISFAFEKTEKHSAPIEEGGIFDNNSQSRFFAYAPLSSTMDEALILNFTEQLRTTTYPTMKLESLKRTRSITEAKLPDSKGSFAIICWGGHFKNQWPTPAQYDAPWGHQFIKKSKNKKIKKDNDYNKIFESSTEGFKPPQNPRTDLKNNTCELFFYSSDADLGKLTENVSFYSLGVLSGYIELGTDRKSPLHLPSPTKDFRTSSTKGANLELNSLIKYILDFDHKEHVPPELEEEGDDDDTDTAADTQATDDSGPTKDTDSDAADSSADDNTDQDDTQNSTQTSQPQPSGFQPCTQSRIDERPKILKHVQKWIKKTDTKLLWNEDDYTFEITELKSKNADCQAIKALLTALKNTIACKPILKKTTHCHSSIKQIVEYKE